MTKLKAIALFFSVILIAGCAGKSPEAVNGEGQVANVDYTEPENSNFENQEKSENRDKKTNRSTKKIATFIVGAKTKNIALAVGTEMFYHRGVKDYIPVQVKVYNRSKNTVLNIGINDFHIVNDAGIIINALSDDALKACSTCVFERDIQSDSQFSKTIFQGKDTVNWTDFSGTVDIQPGQVLNTFLYFNTENSYDYNNRYTLVFETERDLLKVELLF